MAEKSQQLIFTKGKQELLNKIFIDFFPYLAVGSNTDDVNGFINPQTDDETNGFFEISQSEEPTYERVKLNPTGNICVDYDTGKVSVEFEALIDTNNIIGSNGTSVVIDQFAICDSQDINANTIFYAASTFPSFNKNDDIAISFILEMKI